MDVVKVGLNIAKIRRENNLTQEKVADKLGITVPAISKWENGRSLPDIALLPELAKIFDCTIDHILLADTDRVEELDEQVIDNNLVEQIIHMIEDRNIIGISNQSIIKAFTLKHGYFSQTSVIRKNSIRLNRCIVNHLIVRTNGKEYPMIEKVLFGEVTELYRTKLLNDYGISIPMVYKIDFEEKSILLEDVSDGYVSGRECERIFRGSYLCSQIIYQNTRFNVMRMHWII